MRYIMPGYGTYLMDIQNTFVSELETYLDPLTSIWLRPLEPLLDISYQFRFRISNKTPQYLVYDDHFIAGQSWLTPYEFYVRSRRVAENLKHRECSQVGEVEEDCPTGM